MILVVSEEATMIAEEERFVCPQLLNKTAESVKENMVVIALVFCF
jgi:hypothetical protein